MIRKITLGATLTAALLLATAGGVAAQGFSGATLGLDYNKSLDSSDLGGVNYYGQAEVEAISGISFALDLSFYDFAIAGSDARNVTGHAIYALDSQIALGAYFGRDWIDDETINNYGVQGAYDYGFGVAQAYVGLGDGALDRLYAAGASGNYNFAGGISAIGSVDGVSFDDGSGLTIEIGGEYALAGGPVFSGVLGRNYLRNTGTDIDETYIGVKARIDLGYQNGTTFDRRSFFEAYRAAGG
ncbi:hypothetical protein [Yoonia sp.]|uniref:hypothetical protein n=1 Tax=Yoonia sp. TaxID=2212373 RepID=UPI00391C0015